MTDIQVLVICISVAAPVAALTRVSDLEEALRAEMASEFARMSNEIRSLGDKLLPGRQHPWDS